MGNTEDAFAFYGDMFGTVPEGPVMRFGDLPAGPGSPSLSEDEARQIMHIELPILAGHVLMATDMLASQGHSLRVGNNTTISLQPDTRAEADDLYRKLSVNGSDGTGMNEMPWGQYWGCTLDQFGVRWMISLPL